MQVRKKKRRKRTRVNLIRFFSFIIIIVSIIYGVRWFVFQSGLFDIKMISVEGNTKKADMQIIRETGIDLGNNVLFLDRKEAMQKIMSDEIYGDVRFRFKFPSTLEIRVSERKAMAIVNNKSGWFYEVDKSGLAFEKKYNVSQLPDVPFITVSKAKITIGERIKDKKLQRALELYELFPATFRKNISEITQDSNSSLIIYLNNNMKIFWGDNLNFQKKYDMLGKVVKKIEKEHYVVEYIDIRYGENPVIKLKVGQ